MSTKAKTRLPSAVHTTHYLPQRILTSAVVSNSTSRAICRHSREYVNYMSLVHHGNLPILRRRATLRSNITRFVTAINDATEGTTPDDLEHYRNRLQETLDHHTSLDNSIHGSLNDLEYATDVARYEVYIATAKHAIYKATPQSTLASPALRYPRIHPLRLQSNTQLSIWNPFRATLSRGRVFGSSFNRPWTQTLLFHRLTSMSF